MKKSTLNLAILKYLKYLNTSEWIIDESYKFEFANFITQNVDFNSQTDEEILAVLVRSQTLNYDRARGVQFIQKSGRETLNTFLELHDVSSFRQFQDNNFEDIDWNGRTMSYTALSAWLATLFPDKMFPIPAIGINETINYLFETDLGTFPKTGARYILACQSFMEETKNELSKYPIEEIHLKIWNRYFTANPELNILPKMKFDNVDWNWLAQDFHIFIYREVLKLYKSKDSSNSMIIDDDFEPTIIEGQSKLAIHMRYERNSSLIKKIKENALKSNPMLNCEVCSFSFFEKYGELGKGFIEAHHKNPLNETGQTRTTKEDIALVCSNCHKMIHKGISQIKNNTILSIGELKNMLKE